MSESVAVHALRSALEKAGLLRGERGVLPQSVSSISDDSRAITRDSVFIAVRGALQDGHTYLPAAERAGATLAILDDPSLTALPSLIVSDTRIAAAIAAAAFYGEPAARMRFVAVTGTNGKTTTVGMLRHLLDDTVDRAASIGTLGVLVGSAGEAVEGGSGLTTPGPVELQGLLRQLCNQGVRTVAMETSSHALHQQRIAGVTFDAGVFTNLTRDHLDYHETMEAYFASKALLLQHLSREGAAVVNADDPAWRALPAARRVITFGEAAGADVRADEIQFSPRGSVWQLAAGIERQPVRLPLIGDFNISNALAAAAAADALGMPLREIASRLSTLPQVPGRLEVISERPTVLRDYAHTPDALARALDAVRPFTTGRLLALFGCGGDRDRGKRPEMGRIAEEKADFAIVTSDNPRTEDSERILDDIEAGMKGTNHLRMEDRRAAIAKAIALAEEGDVVILAGKGHETYQIRGTVKQHFDEREIVGEIIAGGSH